MKKLAAHDKWVCLDCRWTAKLPLVDVRAQSRPSYRCPRCNEAMLWTGTAFRPPRKEDDEGWQVAGKLLAAGFRFRSSSQRQQMPRTLADLDAWLKAERATEGWFPERKLSLGRRAGEPFVRWGRMEVPHRQCVMVWLDGAWCEGQLILRGDGSRALPSPVIQLKGARRSVPLTAQSRLRLPRAAGLRRHSPPAQGEPG